MISYYSDLRYKEVIDVHTISLITPGRSKLFGLLGREDDYVLPWTAIVRIGSDIVLVDLQETCQRRKRPKRSFF